LLRDKIILIVSPQPWGKMFVSKHHYAIELAKKGNRIYFLEPPVDEKKSFIKMQSAAQFPSITLVQYSPSFNLNLRFHFRLLFDRLMRRQVNKICKKIGEKIDVLWCFETNLYSDLSWFKARINIYHVVDPVNSKYQIAAANSASIILSVSERILQPFKNSQSPKYFINHGIAGVYFQSAKNLLNNIVEYKRPETIQVGYVGNLLRGPVNYKMITQIILEHPLINFHFWGNDEIIKNSSLASKTFIQFLKDRENVILHGQKAPEQLVNEIKNMDAFILSYVFVEGESDQSNSHKLLEYLSTGKVVISSYVDTYKYHNPLVCMTKEKGDDEFPFLFDKIINELEEFNSSSLQKKRIEFALENNYVGHIHKIENLLESL